MHRHAMKNRHETACRRLACLGDGSRFRLMLALLEARRCVSELAMEVGLSQSCTTRHLQALGREGLVSRERDGRRVCYRASLEEPEVASLLALAMGGVVAGKPSAAGRDRAAPSRSRRASEAGTGAAHAHPAEDSPPAPAEAPPASQEEPVRPALRPGDLEDYLL